MNELAGVPHPTPESLEAKRTMWLVHQNPSPTAIETSVDEPDLEKLRKYGVLLVRGLFGPDEIAAIRSRAEGVVERALRDNRHEPVEARHPEARSIAGDLLSMQELREFDHVLLDARVVGLAKQLLGAGVAYFGDSGIRVGVGGRGFHRDFVDGTAPTRGGLRFVLYLQDHGRYGGGLKVRLGSHRFMSRHRGTMMNVPSRPGDIVVFYLRSSHTGHNVRLRALPELCMHPKLENLVPRRFRVAHAAERMCLLWTFAEPGPHVARYLRWIARDPTPWKSCAYSEELVEYAQQRGVRLLKAVPEHGVLVAPARVAREDVLRCLGRKQP